MVRTNLSKRFCVGSNPISCTKYYMNKEITTVFTGTVDAFLEHCSTLSFDISEEELKNREYENNISYLIKEQSMSREEAIAVYKQLSLECLDETIEELVDDGVLKIIGYDDNGEPLYGAIN